MQHLLKLALILGIMTEGKDEASLSAELQTAISDKLQASLAATQKVTEITGQLKTATDELAALKSAQPELVKLSDVGKAALSAKKEAVKTQLALLKDNNVDATLLSVVENADLTALTALEKDYATQLDAKAPLHCEECSSTKVSRRSSTSEDPHKKGEGTANNTGKPKSVTEAAKEIKLAHQPKSLFSDPQAK